MSALHIEAGEGEPVLLLHGYPQSASSWRHQIPVLAEHHRVIAADWPGFGRAEPPDTPATYHAEVERIGCPTAIIWGDRDRYIPLSTARELAERIHGRP
ncbi:MAG TPA: alpha/beta fold hydrolase [Mycobacterium sp.]|jgi:pimeloyl-ACP methyl ester carboxylesterase|nr:alpha/beta fold hydrolase [Mycobacterium sp.]